MKDIKKLILDLIEHIKTNESAQKMAFLFECITIVLLVGGYPIIHLMLFRMGPLSSLMSIFVLAAVWCVYGSFVFIYTLSKLYQYKTGRSYLQDHHKYKHSYFTLVNFFETAEPHKLDLSGFPTGTWKDYHGLIFGEADGRLIAVPATTEGNICVFGPPGTGKTAGIAIINACSYSGSVLAIDIKGDIYAYVRKHTKRTILRFCPDARNAAERSMHYDPMSGIHNMDETRKRLAVEDMANILIPDEGQGENNYFSSRARKLFQGIVFLLLDQNPDITFPEIIHAILEGNVFSWVTAALNSQCRPAKEQLSSFYGNNEKNVSGAYDCLCSALIHYSNPVLDVLLSPDGGHCISSKDLERGADIYLQISQKNLDVYGPLFTLIIQQISTNFAERPDSSTGIHSRPILVIADELPALSFNYDLLNRNLSTLRSKSVTYMIICQNLSQLDYKYDSTGERSIIGNCAFQVILGCNDPKSAKDFSDLFGQKRVLTRSNSESIHSKSISVSEGFEKVYPPETFGDLPATGEEIIYFKGRYAKIQKLNCYK